jgi:outer membrane biosynthesis protein TonB
MTGRNPVALEVNVNVSGARAGGSSDSRDLFSEETKTVLVFKDGAVIGMSAAVTVGQLLFLTNKKSNEEVVCQVLHKRNHRPTSCYVELQFTEEKPDFWGVALPEGESGGSGSKAAMELEAEQVTEDDAGDAVAQRSAEDAEQLKKEAEALRTHLLGKTKKNLEGTGAKTAIPGGREEKKQESPEWQVGELSAEAMWASGSVGEPTAVVREEQATPRRQVQNPPVGRPAGIAEGAGVRTDSATGSRQAEGGHSEKKEEPKSTAPSRLRASRNGGATDGVEVPKSADASQLKVDKSVCATEAVTVAKVKLELASVNEPTPEPVMKAAEEARAGATATEKAELVKPVEEAKVEAAPTATEKVEPARRTIGMVLPNRMAESRKPAEGPKDPEEELLPKPSLDFSKMPVSAVNLDENDPRSTYMIQGPGMERFRVAGLSVVLMLAVAGGAWYGKWWQYLHLAQGKRAVAVEGKKKEFTAEGAEGPQSSKRSETQAPVAGATGVAGEENPKSRQVDGASGTGLATRDVAGTKDEMSNGVLTGTGGGTGENAKGAEVAPLEKAVGTREKKTAGKKKIVTSAGGDANGAEPVASDAPLIPAKLLKAAAPVYPPDAMRDFITGNVKAEAVVEASGRVGEVKVISGPQALRGAAVEALKQYEYAPGTQGGKAVATKVEATVKFWFNP